MNARQLLPIFLEIGIILCILYLILSFRMKNGKIKVFLIIYWLISLLLMILTLSIFIYYGK